MVTKTAQGKMYHVKPTIAGIILVGSCIKDIAPSEQWGRSVTPVQ